MEHTMPTLCSQCQKPLRKIRNPNDYDVISSLPALADKNHCQCDSPSQLTNGVPLSYATRRHIKPRPKTGW